METVRTLDYKQLTYPQLRSFCEIARHGTMKAAADKLNVAQPTIWKQIRALERTLAVKLVESHRRGTRLTEEGRLLLGVCGPAVNEIDTVAKRFAHELRTRPQRLVVSATPRVCHEDLPDCLPRFSKEYPQVQLVFREVGANDVVPLVETGEADIGLADIQWSEVREEMDFTVCYEIEPVLAVPVKHPLATKRRVRLEDLSHYPLLNARDSFPVPGVNAALNQAGAFDHPNRRVELFFAQTILHYVRLDYGIGVVGRASGQKKRLTPGIVERSLARLLPMIPVHAVYRRRLTPHRIHDAFIDVLRRQLGVASRRERAKPSSARKHRRRGSHPAEL